jgi:signal transduction histidine kinase
MSGRVTRFAGVGITVAGLVVLAGWAVGNTTAASIVPGWRQMVPSSAFGFVCVGLALAVASAANPLPISSVVIVRLAGVAAAIVPLLTLFEYALGVRWGVESWLGFSFDDPLRPYDGRMSAVTCACFLLLSTAALSLTGDDRWAARLVRLTGGAALVVSWIAVLVVSFESARLTDEPEFPGMAALTIVLMGITSATVIACSTQAMTRLRDADAGVVIKPWLLVAAFVCPLLLGSAQSAFDRFMDPSLVDAVVTVAFALAVSLVVWRGLGRWHRLVGERREFLAELEARVAERTSALASANEQMRRSEERLREADRRKDEFLATLAHELRNPLAPIRTSIEVLKHPGGPGEAEHAHRLIDRQMLHMVRLIDDLLDVSRITADKLKLRMDPLDMNDVVQQAIETTRVPIDRAFHELVVRLPPVPVIVVGDSGRLSQVVANLIQNACKYTPPGGRIEVSAAIAGVEVELRVKDNGVGIPALFLPRLFEKFSQVAPALNGAEGGLGLGLAIVRELVTMHGGAVRVHSDGAGCGSEFIVALPLAPADVAAERATAEEDGVGEMVASRRVLVADDNADNTDALALLLRHRGHVVETAGDGEEAYSLAERFRPEVVLLDIGMPKLNGYDVCRKIRQQAWGRSMRVVAQTGWGQAQDRLRSEEAGFDGHLVKPVDPSMLDVFLRS